MPLEDVWLRLFNLWNIEWSLSLVKCVTVLVRHVKDAREPVEDLSTDGLVLASEIDFQVMGMLDVRTSNELSAQSSRPDIPVDTDPRDDRGNADRF